MPSSLRVRSAGGRRCRRGRFPTVGDGSQPPGAVSNRWQRLPAVGGGFQPLATAPSRRGRLPADRQNDEQFQICSFNIKKPLIESFLRSFFSKKLPRVWGEQPHKIAKGKQKTCAQHVDAGLFFVIVLQLNYFTITLNCFAATAPVESFTLTRTS